MAAVPNRFTGKWGLNVKLYKCPKCGATYTHDKSVNHAVYFCTKRVDNTKPRPSS